MTTNYRIIRDLQGSNITGGITAAKLSVNNQFIEILAGVTTNVTVPTINGINGPLFAIIQASSVSTGSPVRVWMLPGSSPVLAFPTAGVASDTLAVLTDIRTSLAQGSTIQLKSRVDADVSIQYYFTPFVDK